MPNTSSFSPTVRRSLASARTLWYSLAASHRKLQRAPFLHCQKPGDERLVRSYREQFFYTAPPSDDDASLPPILKPTLGRILADTRDGSDVINTAYHSSKKVFGRFPEYDFSGSHIMCKFYEMKIKDFGDIEILFGQSQVCSAKDMVSLPKMELIEYPYIFYDTTPKANQGGNDSILASFTKRFVQFCRDLEKAQGGGMQSMSRDTHIIRDAIHGDIEIPEPYYQIIHTPEFQRLSRIKQLATAPVAFSNATHTRYAHSIGTFHIMEKSCGALILNCNQSTHPYRPNPPRCGSVHCFMTLAMVLTHALKLWPKRQQLTHEDWTEILSDEESSIRPILREHYHNGDDADQVYKELLS